MSTRARTVDLAAGDDVADPRDPDAALALRAQRLHVVDRAARRSRAPRRMKPHTKRVSVSWR